MTSLNIGRDITHEEIDAIIITPTMGELEEGIMVIRIHHLPVDEQETAFIKKLYERKEEYEWVVSSHMSERTLHYKDSDPEPVLDRIENTLTTTFVLSLQKKVQE